MSICIEDLYDYELVKKCRVCKKVLLKSNFNKKKRKKMAMDMSVDFVVRSNIILLEIDY